MSPRSLNLVLVAIILFIELSCRDPSPQSVVETVEQETAEPQSQNEPLSAADLEPAATFICDVYEAWPRSLLDGGQAGRSVEVVQALPPRWADLLDVPTLSARVTMLCPEVVPAESLPQDGSIPRPESALVGFPGLYPPAESSTRSREHARFEWTAVGLGCLGLTDGEDDDLAELEESFLAEMGYTLEGYVSTATEMNDPQMSERIFQRIVTCAHRFGAEPIE